ncbi:hypothetical protein AXG93_4519s1040 [Marchantia polymorpha subsp. ruderalis]|uniref:Uncharacterized protein n=1 Tax=Marchantia polymorpha subsp. ruderalis TaxID=1480154 RepID=A0A176WMY2_MARPO|nr:hypothetical protein AXG93_4519s1040 [Marchantia polymorpha subsp. ruderalis]
MIGWNGRREGGEDEERDCHIDSGPCREKRGEALKEEAASTPGPCDCGSGAREFRIVLSSRWGGWCQSEGRGRAGRKRFYAGSDLVDDERKPDGRHLAGARGASCLFVWFGLVRFGWAAWREERKGKKLSTVFLTLLPAASFGVLGSS